MKKNRKEITVEAFIKEIWSDVNTIESFVCFKLWSLIVNGHTAIIVLVSIAIASTIIMGTTILIRQRKILRKLDELTKKPEEPSTEDKP